MLVYTSILCFVFTQNDRYKWCHSRGRGERRKRKKTSLLLYLHTLQATQRRLIHDTETKELEIAWKGARFKIASSFEYQF